MRYLAVDIGGRRTGFAIGERELGMVQPLNVVEHPHEEAMLLAVDAAIAEHGPDELVIGLPLNMDDSEGPAARNAHRLAEALRERTGLEVHLQDERLTSFEADARMAQSGRTHAGKKRIRDAIAAAALLEDFIART